MKNTCLLFLFLLLTGCMATGPIYTPESPPSDQEALVYIYRPAVQAGISLRTAAISVDDKPAAELSNGGYSIVRLTPGEHVLTQGWINWPGDVPVMYQKQTTKLSLAPGGIAYAELNVSLNYVPGGNVTRWTFQPVDAISGSQRIAECRKQVLEPATK